MRNTLSPAYKTAKVGTFSFLDRKQQPVFVDTSLVEGLAAGRKFSAQDRAVLEDILGHLADKGCLPFPVTPQEANYLRKQPKEKWLDYLVYRYKFILFPRRKIVADFPVYLLIEPASVCNLRCVMCFQVDKSFTRKPYMGLMDMGLFRDVVDEAVEGGTQAVTLASRGEPTLHPQFGEMLNYMAGKFIELKVITNATWPNEAMCHDILSSDVNLLVFSVDAHNKNVYEQIRVGANFKQVYGNIVRFHEIREKHYPSSALNTRISGVRFRDDQDPEGFVRFWSPIVDEVGMKDAVPRWNTYANTLEPELTSPCWYLWERLYIWFDGSTNPCDADYKSYLSPGNVRDSGIRDIWHGEKLNALRRDHLEGRRTTHCPCDRCHVKFE